MKMKMKMNFFPGHALNMTYLWDVTAGVLTGTIKVIDEKGPYCLELIVLFTGPCSHYK